MYVRGLTMCCLLLWSCNGCEAPTGIAEQTDARTQQHENPGANYTRSLERAQEEINAHNAKDALNAIERDIMREAEALR